MTKLTEQEAENHYLGQFIPLQYHHNMLMDKNRMVNFKSAIDCVVMPGSKVLELGGGTGVLSWFAAEKADQVWCVEYNPELVKESRRLLSMNSNGHKVEVVHADAFEYLPPEPVDVVICEMIHAAMLREKQVEVLASFKHRYQAHFGMQLPIFVPTASLMAVQPLQQHYEFEGYHAPIIQIQEPTESGNGSIEMAAPALYRTIDFTQTNELDIIWEGQFTIEKAGTVNALRFITKNILAILLDQSSTIDWLNRHLALPLGKPLNVKCGDTLQISIHYRAGGSITSLQNSIRAELITPLI